MGIVFRGPCAGGFYGAPERAGPLRERHGREPSEGCRSEAAGDEAGSFPAFHLLFEQGRGMPLQPLPSAIESIKICAA
jgi:hypothetical protein